MLLDQLIECCHLQIWEKVRRYTSSPPVDKDLFAGLCELLAPAWLALHDLDPDPRLLSAAESKTTAGGDAGAAAVSVPGQTGSADAPADGELKRTESELDDPLPTAAG